MTANYPRRQQLRRLRRAGARGIEAALALAGALMLAWTGEAALAFAAGLLAAVLSLDGARALRLAARSAVGAESEARVRRSLERLVHEGWRVRHGVGWPGAGDLDHVVRAPGGIGFVVETKTRRYSHAHLRRTVAAARWLARRRRHYPAGVHPVICVVRARSVEHAQDGVLVVSLDRLLLALRAAAAETPPHTDSFSTTASMRPEIATSASLPTRPSGIERDGHTAGGARGDFHRSITPIW